MATPGASSTLFPAPPDPELVPDGKPKTAAVKKPGPKTLSHADHARPENLERAMVVVESKDPPGKEKTPPKKEPEEEVLELKTPGFIRLFGSCDNCEAESEENDDDHRHKAHETSSSDESEEDHAASSSAHHQPRHVIPVVHLRVPMKNEDDVRKVVAALQLRGVLEVACDLENHIVKVTGNVDPDRLLKKVKKVKRKSKLISYTDPVEMPPPPFHSTAAPPPAPSPPYPFHPPAYEERLRPPPREPHGFPRRQERPRPPPQEPHGFPSGRPNMHFSREAFYRPPPPPAFYPGYVPRPPSSPPHYSSSGASFFHERSPPHRRCSTSPPRRRSYYYHDTSAPSFRPPPPPPPPPPPMGYPHHSSPWGPGPYDFYQVPDRMMHIYH